MSYAYAYMDTKAADVKQYHREILRSFMADYYDEDMDLDSKTFQALNLFISDKIKSSMLPHPILDPFILIHFPKNPLEDLVNKDKLTESTSSGTVIKASVLGKDDKDNNLFDIAKVVAPALDKLCDDIDRNISLSSSYPDFLTKMQQSLATIKEAKMAPCDYLLISIYYNVLLDSLDFWSDFTENMRTKSWEHIQSGWDRIRPYARADAEGAVEGAIYGGITGAISGGGLAGAAAGAAVGAVAGGCARSLTKWLFS